MFTSSYLLFSLLNSFSQNRNNTWYFGYQAGLNFNTNPPSVLNDGQLSGYEASSTISDNNGNLLFYTDGVTVWNRNQVVMPNGSGLLGGGSAAQSAIIIPKPCDSNIYYVFTVPERESGLDAFAYSIVDMSLDGGLGEVTIKNNIIHTPTSEKLTAILKPNGIDYWVIIKEAGSDAFLAYTVSASGFNPIPVISHPGGTISALGECTGYIKISHNGSKLCTSFTSLAITELFDFNNSTGIVSNPIAFPYYGPYGIEFSPDDSKLYLGAYIDGKIYQYNLLAGSPTAIQNSQVIVVNTGNFIAAMKLAPDNKIYVSIDQSHYAAVIDQPNQLGIACNFIVGYVDLGIGFCKGGLPNNLESFVICNPCPSVVGTTVNAAICAGQTYELPSGSIVNSEGIYLDTVRSVGSCDSIITTVHLSVSHVSNINTNVQICANQTYQLPAGTIVSTAGVYIDTLRSTGSCDSIITNTTLSVFPVSISNTEAHICENETFHLPSGTIVHTEGIYSDTTRSIASCDSIINTIHLFVNDVSNTNIIDSIFVGQTYILPSGETVGSAGVYQSILLNSVGCDSVITTTLKLKQKIADCITMKNALTPNGDGINDYWVLYRYRCFKKLEVNVYNRYGSLVYHSDDYKNDWNGKYKNKELPDGTYYYVIKVISFDGGEHVFKDNVTILR